MKETELRNYTTCRLCHESIGKAGPVFYRLRIEQYVVDMANIQRQAGLTALLGGNAAIAQAMGDDQDMAHQVSESQPLAVCLKCATDPDRSLPVAALLERSEQEGNRTRESE